MDQQDTSYTPRIAWLMLLAREIEDIGEDNAGVANYTVYKFALRSDYFMEVHHNHSPWADDKGYAPFEIYTEELDIISFGKDEELKVQERVLELLYEVRNAPIDDGAG